MGKTKLIVIISAIVVFCFVPMVNMPYEVIVQKQFSEEYTTLEPYIVLERVVNPYYQAYGNPTPDQTRTDTKEVTKYREVTKTRLVTRPVVETRTKRVSILRYLLR